MNATEIAEEADLWLREEQRERDRRKRETELAATWTLNRAAARLHWRIRVTKKRRV